MTFLQTIAAKAFDACIDGIFYNLSLEDKTAEVTSGDDKVVRDYYSGDVVIPGIINYDGTTYKVTSIGPRAFSQRYKLTSVTMPDEVETIETYAFWECDDLNTVICGNGLKTIGANAFQGSGLRNINLPNSLVEIKGRAFAYTSLKEIVLPDNLKIIGGFAFSNGPLSSITIGKNVYSIGQGVVGSCYNLNSIIISDDNPYYDSRDNCNAIIESATNKLVCGCCTTVIPNTVTDIDDYAFDGCWSLKSIDIPSSVKSIGINAFQNCSALTSITIPGGVTNIGNDIFRGCQSMVNCTLSYGVQNIGDRAFMDCSKLESIAFPNSVTNIGESVFAYCSNLLTVTIGARVANIQARAFISCRKMNDVYCLPEKMPKAEKNIFDSSSTRILHVPAALLNDYKATAPWSGFAEILPIETDGISPISADEKESPTYDLQGRRKAEGGVLQRGIYVKDGRKFVVK